MTRVRVIYFENSSFLAVNAPHRASGEDFIGAYICDAANLDMTVNVTKSLRGILEAKVTLSLQAVQRCSGAGQESMIYFMMVPVTTGKADETIA